MSCRDTKASMAGSAEYGAVLLLLAAGVGSAATPTEELTWAVQLFEHYPILRTDITYYTANNYESKLDVYLPNGSDKPKPTLVYFHGGGWLGGYNKNSSPFAFLPILQLGWNIVNVDYRSASISPAPAAVRDCLCALRWVGRNAEEYHIDTKQIVLMGHSAGGGESILFAARSPSSTAALLLVDHCPGRAGSAVPGTGNKAKVYPTVDVALADQ